MGGIGIGHDVEPVRGEEEVPLVGGQRLEAEQERR
jgi:hypothetical protein